MGRCLRRLDRGAALQADHALRSGRAGRERALEELGFPLLKTQIPTREAYKQATHTFLDTNAACDFLDTVQAMDWRLRELPAISPFSFPIYASVIKESMMLEDPTAAIERIYREMYAKVESVTASSSQS